MTADTTIPLALASPISWIADMTMWLRDRRLYLGSGSSGGSYSSLLNGMIVGPFGCGFDGTVWTGSGEIVIGCGTGSLSTLSSAGFGSSGMSGGGVVVLAPVMRSFRFWMAASSSGGGLFWPLMAVMRFWVAFTILSVLEMVGSGRV